MEGMLLPVEVEAFVKETIDKIIDVLDPSHIMLAGSFGKDSYLFGDGVLMSDFEFVFICDKRWSIKRKKKLLRELNKSSDYEINLKGYLEQKVLNQILSNYATKNPGYLSLEFFDTFSAPLLLYSKPKKKEFDLNLDQTDIPPWESWKLLVNRLVDVITLNPYDSEGLSENAQYRLLKVYESFGDIYLMVKGLYVKNISERLRVIRDLSSEDLKRDLSPGCTQTWRIIVSAMQARASHDLDLFRISSDHDYMEDINEWLKFTETQVFQFPDSLNKTRITGYLAYAENIKFQESFSELNYMLNNEISNLIRIVFSFRSLFGKVNLFNLRYNWQHLILISIVVFFLESQGRATNFSQTRRVLSLFLNEKEVFAISDEELLSSLLSFWKLLR
jgi:hypothetical protein